MKLLLSDYLLNEAYNRGIYDNAAEKIVELLGKSDSSIKKLRVQLHYARKENKTLKEKEILRAIDLIKSGTNQLNVLPQKTSVEKNVPEKTQQKANIIVKPTESQSEKILEKLQSTYSPKEALKKINKFLETHTELSIIEKNDLKEAKKILEKRISASDNISPEKQDKEIPKQKTKKTYDEISKELGITKMGAVKATQRSLIKVYKGLKQEVPEATTEQILSFMTKYFDPDLPDMKKLFSILPKHKKEKLHETEIPKDINSFLLESMSTKSYVERLKEVKPYIPMSLSYYEREKKTYISNNTPQELYSHYFNGAKPGFRTIKHYFSIAKHKNDSDVMSKLIEVAKIIDKIDKRIKR